METLVLRHLLYPRPELTGDVSYHVTLLSACNSPAGETIAYVHKSDLYVLTRYVKYTYPGYERPMNCSSSPDAKPIRVTTGGNSSVFHGVPDWVYEEETYMSDYALWWSSDSAELAFLRFDETNVSLFRFKQGRSLSGICEDEISQTWVPQSYRQRPHL